MNGFGFSEPPEIPPELAARHAEHRTNRRAGESEAHWEERQVRRRKRGRKRKDNAAPEEEKQRRAKVHEQYLKKKASESSEAKARRLGHQRDYNRRVRAAWSPIARARDGVRTWECLQRRIQEESPDECIRRKADVVKCSQKWMKSGTPEEQKRKKNRAREYGRSWSHRRYVELRKLKVAALDYAGEPCCRICGEEYPGVLIFHHLNPRTKRDLIALLLEKHGLDATTKAEIDKCGIVCMNCHEKVHRGLYPIDLSGFRKRAEVGWRIYQIEDVREFYVNTPIIGGGPRVGVANSKET